MRQAAVVMAQVGGGRKRACANAASGLTIPQAGVKGFCTEYGSAVLEKCRGRGRGRKRAWRDLRILK